MSIETQVVLYAVEERVARITLNRPNKRNALNTAVITELKACLRRADADGNVRVVLITGAGPDFCSGADLSELRRISEASVEENADDARSLLELFTLVREISLPVVAAVQGRALAGGCGLATVCDVVLASSSARFGYPEVKIGFVPAMVMAILRRNVSEKRAFALVTRGVEVTAEEALRIGLINEVLPSEGFENLVAEYLDGFKAMSKSAVSLTKRLLYQIDGMGFVEALQTGADVNVLARSSEDCKLGIAKFLNKQ